MIDRVVGGTYRIVEKIGEGGMGDVYRGFDLMLEREVAIKAIRPELSREPEIVERFRAEAKMLARVNHPAIATIYSFFHQGEELFLAMEFVRGESLSRLLLREGAMPAEKAIALLSVALDGIEQAHRAGIVHRDLKPDNLMITESGAVKVMDFGIGRMMGSGRLTRTGLLIGTLRYMAPEQIRGEEVDRRTDVYALGTVLYEMVTGRVPFDGDSDYAVLKAQVEEHPAPPSVAVRGMPAWLDGAILRCLAKEPAARFGTVEELRLCLLTEGQRTTSSTSGFAVSSPAAWPIAASDSGIGARPHGGSSGGGAGSGTALAKGGSDPRAPALAAGPAPDSHPRPDAQSAPAVLASPAQQAPLAPLPLAPLPPNIALLPTMIRPSPAAPPPAPRDAPRGGRPRWHRGMLATVATVAVVVVAALVALGSRLARHPNREHAAAPAATQQAAHAGAPPAPLSPSRAAPPPARSSSPAAAEAVTAPAARQPATAETAAGGSAQRRRHAGATDSAASVGASTGEAGGAAGAGRSGGAAGTKADRAAGTKADRTAAGGRKADRATAAGSDGGRTERSASGGAPTGATGAAATPTHPTTSGVGGFPADELRQLGGELQSASDEIRNLYADYLKEKERSGATLTAPDQRLKDELSSFQNATERFNQLFNRNFFTRTKLRFGRFSHGEDERAQILRFARTLQQTGSKVDELISQVAPSAAVHEAWRRMRHQWQRIAEICSA